MLRKRRRCLRTAIPEARRFFEALTTVDGYADAYAPGPPYRAYWTHVVSLRVPHRP